MMDLAQWRQRAKQMPSRMVVEMLLWVLWVLVVVVVLDDA